MKPKRLKATADKKQRRAVADLYDSYVIQLLARLGYRRKDISPNIVRVKRLMIMIYRRCKGTMTGNEAWADLDSAALEAYHGRRG